MWNQTAKSRWVRHGILWRRTSSCQAILSFLTDKCFMLLMVWDRVCVWGGASNRSAIHGELIFSNQTCRRHYQPLVSRLISNWSQTEARRNLPMSCCHVTITVCQQSVIPCSLQSLQHHKRHTARSVRLSTTALDVLYRITFFPCTRTVTYLL